MPAVTLRERLTIRTPLGQPTEAMRRNRERLCCFIRSVEEEIFLAVGSARVELRQLLGWDDETFQSFINSPLITHSSPHTAMNAFPPMLSYPWVQYCIQTLSKTNGPGKPVHLRTLVMHNNLGDLRWRPYAWWHRTSGGSIQKTTFFSRGHSVRRRVLLALPVPEIDLSACCHSDRTALTLARNARTFAYFAAIYRAGIERIADLHLPHGTIEVPLNILNAFTFTEESLKQWIDLTGQTPGQVRYVDASGELAVLPHHESALYAARIRELGSYPIVCTNAQSFAQVYQFGITCMIGAEKMARYLLAMNEDIKRLYDQIGWSYPFPEFIPITRIPAELVAPIDEPSVSILHEFGLAGSLPICVADHGDNLAQRLNAMLPRDYAEFAPPAPIS
jgi:hypothetical protein